MAEERWPLLNPENSCVWSIGLTLTVDFDPNSLTQGVLLNKHSTGTSGAYMFSITLSNGNLSFTVINFTPTRVNVTMALQAGVDDSPGYQQARVPMTEQLCGYSTMVCYGPRATSRETSIK